MSKKQILSNILKIAVAGGIIFWLVQSGHFELSRLQVFLDPIYLIPGLFLGLANVFINHVRWVVFLRAQGLNRGLWESLPLTFIGLFFNYAIPGGVGGDVVKGYYVAQESPGKKLVAATTVLMDRVVGLYAMLCLAAIAVLVNLPVVSERPVLASTAVAIFSVWFILTMAFAAALSTRVRHRWRMEELVGKLPFGQGLARLYAIVQSYRNCLKQLFLAWLMSLGAQLVAITFMMLIGYAMAADLPLGAYFFAVPIGFIISAVPIAPAGVGVGQVAFLVLFRMYTGEETQVGALGITAFQISLLCWGLFGAYFYARRKKPVELEVST